jgi:hypothetical protein
LKGQIIGQADSASKAVNKSYTISCTIKKFRYTAVRIVLKADRQIVERVTIITPNTYIHDTTLSWLVIGTSIKSGGVKIVYGPKP